MAPSVAQLRHRNQHCLRIDALTFASAVVTNPEDPKFDLEAFLKAKAEEK